jgi:hypothetical protein
VVEQLWIVVYMGGLVIGAVGPLTSSTEKSCLEVVARTQMLQPMNGESLAHFTCEWRKERPQIQAFVR